MAKTFNLKSYQKINGDEHIEMRLRNVNKKSEEPEVINEKQLEDYRATESEVITEKQLEQKRTGSADRVVEARLEDQDPKNGVKYRNPDAYAGNINKLEEKRLLSKPVEKEEYESATIKSKEGKWWNSKSPDGLKLASDSGLKKNAVKELDFDKPRWSDVGELEKAEEGEADVGLPDKDDDEEIIEEELTPKIKRGVETMIMDPPKEGNDPIPHFYTMIHYDPTQFENDEEVKEAGLEKLLSVRPELANFVTTNNITFKGFDRLVIRAIGDELAGLVGKKEEPVLEGEDFPIGNVFEEISYEDRDVEGTPMAVGRVKINTEVHEMNRDAIVRDVVDYINGKHPNLNLTEDALDLSQLNNGEIGFLVSTTPIAPPSEGPTELPSETGGFPIGEEK